jgi:hypothetical protein
MTKTITIQRMIAAAAATVIALACAFVLSTSTAHAYPTTQWITNVRLTSGQSFFSPSRGGLVRSYGYSTGSGWTGAEIIDAYTSGSSGWYYCSTNGCIASTPTYTCGSWYSGSQAGIHDHSSWADYYNGNYETC